MKTMETSLFYVKMEKGRTLANKRKVKKEGLPVETLGRDLPFLAGSGSTVRGSLRVYYAQMPEYDQSFWNWRKDKPWKKERAAEVIGRTLEAAAECDERLLSPELGGTVDVPVSLFAARLYAGRPFERICLSLSEEGGDYQREQAMELLTPYLPKLRQILWAGGSERQKEELEDYFYREFGLVMTDTHRPWAEEALWLDLSDQGEEKWERQGQKGTHRRIDRTETLKFLDTMVKNRYNTGVN